MATISAPSSGPAPAGPWPVRWTCAEFHRFGDMGAFEGRRAMLIDGVILEQGPMNPPHAITLRLAKEAIRTAFGSGWWLRPQLPLVLGQVTDPVPDLAVVPGRPRDYSGHPTTADLVVEVADSSVFTRDGDGPGYIYRGDPRVQAACAVPAVHDSDRQREPT